MPEIEQIIETKISDLPAGRQVKKDILATKEDIANLRGELKVEMAENKAEMIKWMFIFWVGQVAATIAIVKLFMH